MVWLPILKFDFFILKRIGSVRFILTNVLEPTLCTMFFSSLEYLLSIRTMFIATGMLQAFKLWVDRVGSLHLLLLGRYAMSSYVIQLRFLKKITF